MQASQAKTQNGPDSDILDKIDKLLRTANDKAASVQEAETAMLFAQRIALKHGIDLATYSPGTQAPLGNLVIADVKYGFVHRSYRKILLYTLAHNFRCRLILRASPDLTLEGAILVGDEKDVTIVLRVHAFALEVCERECMAYCFQHLVPGMTVGQRDHMRIEWCEGFVIGVRDRFKQQVEEIPGMALALLPDPEIANAVKDMNLENKRVDSEVGTAGLAYQHGYVKGKNMADPHDGELPSGPHHEA